ncbi:MAG: ATP-dependent zinc metalloprotease FtsH [Parcubacteria group bacterium GW2011_GWA2_42_14]|nr:MAG: ATP-dependent zinc metalloprotease FtsH [Parcubacteria group bacterium GW2011_GWA2_42_14]OGZ98877.1 MAG: cell division protein FtsH [Candidatus Sungbacteria bacterium RIFCSPHIGHO2_02_FULL_41_12b]
MPDKNGGTRPKTNILIWFIIGFLAFMFFQIISGVKDTSPPLLDYSSFKRETEKGNVAIVIFSRHRESLIVDLKTAIEIDSSINPNKKKSEKLPFVSQRFIVHISKENISQLVKELEEKKVRVIFDEAPNPDDSFWSGIISSLIWMGLMLAIFIWVMRRMRGGAGGSNNPFSFGKNKAKLVTEADAKKVTFKDIAGCDEAKEELREIVEFLKDPLRFNKLGGHIPKGVLLVGSPGTGKTLLAKAVAGEAGVPFYTISGSDFVEMFVGVGASRVRDLFEQAKKHAPCIIFMDEIDAVGRHRGAGIGGGHDEREQTLNQLLVEMDGFGTDSSVIMVAATNRPDILDPALLRPGRFDRQVVVPRPDLRGRLEILKVHIKGKPMDESVDLTMIARGTPGFSGADLANLLNEAALLASRQNKEKIEPVDLDKALDKILMGTERKSAIIPEHERRITAWHEAGHAVVVHELYLEDTYNSDPLHKVTIIPRGEAGGLTQQLPHEDRHYYSMKYLKNRLAVLMGGRVAEEIKFKDKSTGAGNDIGVATELSRKMVCEWGMSDKLGPITFGKKQELVFLGREVGREQNYSHEVAKAIDEEIKFFITEAYQRAGKVISEKWTELERLAAKLLEAETLTGEEVKAILESNPV